MDVPVPARGNIKVDSEANLATIELFDFIDPFFGMSVASLSQELKALGDIEEINLLIHSRGGNAIEGFALFSVLAMHPARVLVDVIGVAASAASIVAMAGDRVRISQVGHMMIHDPWLCLCGNATVLRREAERLDVLRPAAIRAYRRRVKAEADQISEWMSEGDGDGTWFDAERAVELGFADEMYEAPIPQQRVRLDGLGNVPEAVMATFGEPPETSTETDTETQLEDLVEEPEDAKVLAEALDHLETYNLYPEAEALSTAELEALECLAEEGLAFVEAETETQNAAGDPHG